MTRLNLGSGIHELEGFRNLDKTTGWTFESGLAQFPDEIVEGVTISHALMHVELEHWGYVFSEIARVLEPGGVVRITEDWTTNPASSRYGGFHDAVTLTSPTMVYAYLTAAGLEPRTVDATTTHFKDDSLIQNWHGAIPKVFHVEGLKA